MEYALFKLLCLFLLSVPDGKTQHYARGSVIYGSVPAIVLLQKEPNASLHSGTTLVIGRYLMNHIGSCSVVRPRSSLPHSLSLVPRLERFFFTSHLSNFLSKNC